MMFSKQTQRLMVLPTNPEDLGLTSRAHVVEEELMSQCCPLTTTSVL